ncbi:MAG: rod-binding protein [Pirellulales bacterium]
MNIASTSGTMTSPGPQTLASGVGQPRGLDASAGQDEKEVRAAFDQFVGETFFGQMLKSMRQMTDKPAYFHGGRGEEVFQTQLDQVLSEKLAENCAGTFTGPMFELFSLSRR